MKFVLFLILFWSGFALADVYDPQIHIAGHTELNNKKIPITCSCDPKGMPYQCPPYIKCVKR